MLDSLCCCSSTTSTSWYTAPLSVSGQLHSILVLCHNQRLHHNANCLVSRFAAALLTIEIERGGCSGLLIKQLVIVVPVVLILELISLSDYPELCALNDYTRQRHTLCPLQG